MAAVVSRSERRVAVRLSEVPRHLREEFMHKLHEREGGVGLDSFIEWGVAVMAARQDPVLIVPEWKADLVLKKGKAPPGPIPEDLVPRIGRR